jgi:hypothetical protein
MIDLRKEMRKMKKKLAIGILTGAIILGGAGTFAFAQTNGDVEKEPNFGQMKPYIEEMHPDLTKQEQKEMFDSCHGDGGMMEDGSMKGMMENGNTENMMNNL